MSFQTPNGSPTSQGGWPVGAVTRLPNGKEATYFNVGEDEMQERLRALQQERRRATPDDEPFEEEASPMPPRQQCVGLWASLADEETLDQVRHNIPCAWYQLYRVHALLQFVVSMAEKGTAWKGGSSLFGDGSNSHEELYHAHWRDLADSLCRILDRLGATKDEMRAHVEKIKLEDFWGEEQRHLEPVVAAEDQKYHDDMAEKARQAGRGTSSAPQQIFQLPAPQSPTPRALQDRHPREVANMTRHNTARQRTITGRVQRKTTTRRNAASAVAQGLPEESTNSSPVIGNSFASKAATGKSSKIAYGLNSDNILDNKTRSLRKKTKDQSNLRPASAGVIDGRVDTKRRRGAQRKITTSSLAVP
ncbi:hypothetical protein SAMD00023353_15000010 [Rosellinia necatrix]|uniref:Uncharacterized protein n=1 Tax=Rosellinia necatrix TaxID=77044 RepID=A0A1W2TAL9_ROSNE|nr:hypothetical protein SAMD00023353_15000010 [Rosellinia necatrix]